MFIKMINYGGIDWHDSRTIITQLKWDNQYDIPATKVTDCIVNDIIQEIPYLDPLDVYHAVLSNQTYRFPLLYLSNEKIVFPEKYTDGTWNSYGEIAGLTLKESFAGGQVTYETEYEISNIPYDQICYLVEEHFYAYTKGVPLVERFYHEPFRELRDAEVYLEKMKKHDPCTELSIQIYNRQQISSTEWFQRNMEVVTLSSGDTEKGYSVFVNSHIENLKNQMEGEQFTAYKPSI